MTVEPPESGVSSRRVTADILGQVAARTVNLVLGIVVTLLIARHLGEEGFGEWATIFAVLGITAYLGNLGFDQVAVRRAAAEPGQEAGWIGGLVTLRTAIGVPVALLTAAAIAAVAEDGAVRLAGAVVAASLLLGGVEALRTVFQLRVRNDLVALVELANGAAWGAAAGVVVWQDDGIVALAVAFTAVAAATSAVQAVLALRRARVSLTVSRERWGELVRTGVPVAAGGLLIAGYVRIDQVLVFELAGARDAGLYGAAYRVLDRAQLLPAAVMATLFPLLVRAYSVGAERMRPLVQSSLDVLLLASLPALAFTAVAAEPLTVLLYGEEFADAAPALPILMGAFVLTALGYLTGNVLLVLRLERRFVRYAAAALVFNVALNLALVPSYGFVAAAWITLATEVVVLTLSARAALPLLGGLPGLGRPLRAAAAAAGMALVVLLLDRRGAPIGALAAAGIGTYALLAVALGAARPGELAALLRSRRAL